MRRPRTTSAVLALAMAAVPVAVTCAASAKPTPAPAPSLSLLGSYSTNRTDGLGGEVAALEGDRLYVIDGAGIDIVDVSDPASPVKLTNADLSSYGPSVTSVATSNERVAVAVPAADKTQPGTVVLLDRDGGVLASTTVGALPDQLTFDKTGKRIVVVGEGEPNSYGQPDSVDPLGTVSQIRIEALLRGRDAVTTLDFTEFNVGGPRAAELPAGVRVYGPGASVAQDLEPEYAAIDPANRNRVYVTLQENNAIATVEFGEDPRVVSIDALGLKDHSVDGQGLDPSDRDSAIAINQWPVFGMYEPDAVAAFKSKGSTYLVTANEGDAREWPGIAAEAVRVGSTSYVLDPTAFPEAATLKGASALGRLNASRFTGDTDGDGDFDQIHALGGRSFSIWDASTGEQVFDSGDALERITAEAYPSFFNSNNNEDVLEGRSDDKGPEPEGVAIGKVGKRTLAFVVLERIGGVVVYDVTDPAAPTFLQYLNNRTFDGAPVGPDSGPEVVRFVEGEDSPTGEPLVVVSNEVTGTVSLYAIG